MPLAIISRAASSGNPLSVIKQSTSDSGATRAKARVGYLVESAKRTTYLAAEIIAVFTHHLERNIRKPHLDFKRLDTQKDLVGQQLSKVAFSQGAYRADRLITQATACQHNVNARVGTDFGSDIEAVTDDRQRIDIGKPLGHFHQRRPGVKNNRLACADHAGGRLADAAFAVLIEHRALFKRDGQARPGLRHRPAVVANEDSLLRKCIQVTSNRNVGDTK